MKNEFVEIIKIIFTIIVIIFVIIASILIFIKIFGNSPNDITVLFVILSILVALQVIIVGAIFKIMEDMGSLKEFKKQTVSKVKGVEDRLFVIEKHIKRR